MSLQTWILLSQRPTLPQAFYTQTGLLPLSTETPKILFLLHHPPSFLRDSRPIKAELWRSANRKAHAGRDSKPQSLLQKYSLNMPWWLISCRPQATSTWDPFSVVPCEATPVQSRSWTGKVCVKLSDWGWQHLCSRTFWWRNESPCWSFW